MPPPANFNKQFTPLEDKVLHELMEPFRSRFLLAAYRLRDRLAGDPTVKLRVEDGWRDPVLQDKLYRKGRHIDPKTKLWVDSRDILNPIVTKAPSGMSAHEYRRACHLVLLDLTTPRLQWLPNGDKRWHLIGDVVAGIDGLIWGGNWKMRDLAHVEAADWKEYAKSRHWVPLGETEMG